MMRDDERTEREQGERRERDVHDSDDDEVREGKREKEEERKKDRLIERMIDATKRYESSTGEHALFVSLWVMRLRCIANLSVVKGEQNVEAKSGEGGKRQRRRKKKEATRAHQCMHVKSLPRFFFCFFFCFVLVWFGVFPFVVLVLLSSIPFIISSSSSSSHFFSLLLFPPPPSSCSPSLIYFLSFFLH